MMESKSGDSPNIKYRRCGKRASPALGRSTTIYATASETKAAEAIKI